MKSYLLADLEELQQIRYSWWRWPGLLKKALFWKIFYLAPKTMD